MEEYCKERIKQGISFCEKVNRVVPSSFCLACQGNWEEWWRPNVEEYRQENLKPLTEEQQSDKDLVSVIMPARDCEKPYIQKTIDNLRKMARGPIEIIVVCDGWSGDFDCTVICFDDVIGQRAVVNEGVNFATGKYIFRLDSHCALSQDWDARMKSSCGETDIVVPVYDHIDPDAWKPTGRDTAFWWLDKDLHCRSVRPWKPIHLREIEEDTMAFSGGAWMIRKKYYNQLGGHDESLGKHGAVGPEWSLKVWLTGGRVLIRTDVVCAHLFRSKSPFGYDWTERENAFKKLRRMWVKGEDPRRTRPIEWLLYKFNSYTKYKPVVSVTMR